MPITKEQIDELVELTAQIPEGPYFADFDDGRDCPNHANSGLAVVDTGRESEWPIARHCHWPVAKWIVLSRVAMPALLETLAEKDAEIEKLSAQNVRVIKDQEVLIEQAAVDDRTIKSLRAELQQANERIAELRESLKELADSPAEFDEPRIGYVVVQMDRGALEAAQKLLE